MALYRITFVEPKTARALEDIHDTIERAEKGRAIQAESTLWLLEAEPKDFPRIWDDLRKALPSDGIVMSEVTKANIPPRGWIPEEEFESLLKAIRE